MFDPTELRVLVRDLDAAALTGPQAVELLGVFTEVERLATAGRALVAARAAETNQWRTSGDRSPEHWLARVSGVTVADARSWLETAARCRSLPQTDRAVRAGRLSGPQAAAVSEAAAADPDAEQSLLDAAPESSLAELRERAEAVKAAVRSAEDEAARSARIRRSRSLRTYANADGSHELRARGSASDIARIRAGLQPLLDRRFAAARRGGEREPLAAYAFDALVELAKGTSTGRSTSKVIVRVDASALQRGTTKAGEVCEIPGFGPVSVDEARSLLGDGFLAVVLTKGVDVHTVVHLGRQFTAHQQTSLEWLQPTCAVLGCASAARLEKDHRDDWARTKRTTIRSADRLCHWHHSLKTAGWHLEPGSGKRRLLPPTGRPDSEPAPAGRRVA
jgi:hypothetical protein